MGFDRIRPMVQPNGSGRARKKDDQAITKCKICLESIFMSESRVWASRVEPAMVSGLVHSSCSERVGATTIGQPTTGGQLKYRT